MLGNPMSVGSCLAQPKAGLSLGRFPSVFCRCLTNFGRPRRRARRRQRRRQRDQRQRNDDDDGQGRRRTEKTATAVWTETGRGDGHGNGRRPRSTTSDRRVATQRHTRIKVTSSAEFGPDFVDAWAKFPRLRSSCKLHDCSAPMVVTPTIVCAGPDIAKWPCMIGNSGEGGFQGDART